MNKTSVKTKNEIKNETENKIKYDNNLFVTTLDKYGFRLVQRKNLFCLGEDSVALAEYAHINSGEKVLDVGTGNGCLVLMLCGKQPKAEFTAVEIMKKNADLAKKNIEINNLTDKIKVIQGDYRLFDVENYGKFDKIICNPPYEKPQNGRISPVAELAAAKFELNGELADFIFKSKELLKPNGSFYLVLPGKRKKEAETLAKKADFIIAESRETAFEKKKKETEKTGKSICLFRLVHKNSKNL